MRAPPRATPWPAGCLWAAKYSARARNLAAKKKKGKTGAVVTGGGGLTTSGGVGKPTRSVQIIRGCRCSVPLSRTIPDDEKAKGEKTRFFAATSAPPPAPHTQRRRRRRHHQHHRQQPTTDTGRQSSPAKPWTSQETGDLRLCSRMYRRPRACLRGASTESRGKSKGTHPPPRKETRGVKRRSPQSAPEHAAKPGPEEERHLWGGAPVRPLECGVRSLRPISPLARADALPPPALAKHPRAHATHTRATGEERKSVPPSFPKRTERDGERDGKPRRRAGVARRRRRGDFAKGAARPPDAQPGRARREGAASEKQTEPVPKSADTSNILSLD